MAIAARRTLFWLAFIPLLAVLLAIAIPACVFDWLDERVYRWALAYERWTFDHDPPTI